ncbi:Glycine/D-amino acid oxidase [Vreelandella subterranea]|uniref:Glycine/D-amino acid oxidase n=1 Tax=Vreelandella subterranea TaxID=416874 RepID=A0A1H9W8P3_9GAMM|nr:FAD-binding oxidoreductase [Halomonas subterranea]SES30194.1 Glycine/D-amino acid oxidase [Halomonas subterranea]
MFERKHVDTVVIGGGIIGCATAWYLHKRGFSVTVIEKGRVAGEQSSRNWGFVRQQGRDLRELPLIMKSLENWRGIDEALGEPTGFVTCGNLAVAPNEKKLAAMRGWARDVADFGLESRVVTGAELEALSPAMARSYSAALYTPSDGRAEPSLATQGIATALKKVGQEVVEQCMVEDLLLESGKVAGVVTEMGEIRCSKVVMAGGAWSGQFLRKLGLSLPQSDLRVTVGRTEAFAHGIETPTWLPAVALRPRQDGGLSFASGSIMDHDLNIDSFRYLGRFLPNFLMNSSSLKLNLNNRFMEQRRHARIYRTAQRDSYQAIRTLDPTPNHSLIEQTRNAMVKAFDFPENLALEETWAGRIDVMPDAIPVIDQVPQAKGLILATGMSGHGFGIGLGVGDVVAELVDRGTTELDLRPFSLSRFSERYFVTPKNLL